LVHWRAYSGVGFDERTGQRNRTSDPLQVSDRGAAVSHQPAPEAGPHEALSLAYPESFRCDVSRERDTANVRPVGELDIATVPLLSAQVAELRQAGCRHLVFDLSELEFIDSSGLRFLLECYADSRHEGFTMALRPGPPAVQQVFELTDTRSHLPFIDC
jgi:anti-anti-sigma factor